MRIALGAASRDIAIMVVRHGLMLAAAGAALVHIAQHNAHHLGQVILLRQIMGRWPPPGGSWTW